MRLVITTPAAAGSSHGNRNTAERWALHLRAGGHQVAVQVQWDGTPADAMIALHARRSHTSIIAWKAQYPARPVALVLTGTDVYQDIHTDAAARQSLELADRVVVLQEKALDELVPRWRAKARVIHQSVAPVTRGTPPDNSLLVTVIGHLRAVKDPFRAGYALRHIDPDVPIEVSHLGQPMEPGMEEEARRLMAVEPRYRWLGEVDHRGAMDWLARSHAMVISSRIEGGAHVVSEAIAAGVPVIASRVSGNVGLLGDDYAGYYPVGEERALAASLARLHGDRSFVEQLERAVCARRFLIDPALERHKLDALTAEWA